jgi:hypothetical protein
MSDDFLVRMRVEIRNSLWKNCAVSCAGWPLAGELVDVHRRSLCPMIATGWISIKSESPDAFHIDSGSYRKRNLACFSSLLAQNSKTTTVRWCDQLGGRKTAMMDIDRALAPLVEAEIKEHHAALINARMPRPVFAVACFGVRNNNRREVDSWLMSHIC